MFTFAGLALLFPLAHAQHEQRVRRSGHFTTGSVQSDAGAIELEWVCS